MVVEAIRVRDISADSRICDLDGSDLCHGKSMVDIMYRLLDPQIRLRKKVD